MTTDKAQEFYEKSEVAKRIKKEVHPYAMLSFGLSIWPIAGYFLFFIPGLSLLSIPLAGITSIISILLGIMSFSKFNKKYYGKWFAIFGIIISILLLIGYIYAFNFLVLYL